MITGELNCSSKGYLLERARLFSLRNKKKHQRNSKMRAALLKGMRAGCRASTWSNTYFLILFEEFGRARIWDLRQAHTPFPPTAHQSSRELLFGGVYPGTGGLSGN